MEDEIISNNHFKAGDVYPLWTIWCRKATNDISILSPYVDNTVKSLLATKYIAENVNKTIYTRIDSETIFEKPYQIRALINCKKLGIRIFHVEDLHAKALIIDNKYVSIGSQNFTSSGRINKETSMISNWSFTSSVFLDTINTWINNAEEIDLEYLIALEVKLKRIRLEISKLRAEHNMQFNEVRDYYLIKKGQELIQNIQILKDKAKTSFLSDYLWLTKTFIETEESFMITFMVDQGKDLRNWKVNRSDGVSTLLTRIKYYPCINISNGSIAYVRLTKTRISFYLTRIWVGWLKLKESRYKVYINCPQDRPSVVNYQIIFSFRGYRENTLDYYFDGAKFNFVQGHFYSTLHKEELSVYFINDGEELNKLLKQCLKGFNLNTIGKPIQEFLKNKYCKLYLVEYLESPVIVADNNL